MVLIYNRRKKRYQKEKSPLYLDIALTLGVFPLTPKIFHRLLATQITQHCQKFSSTKDAKREIDNFIKTYQINTKEAEHPKEHYRTLQEFFQRRLKPKIHKIYKPNDQRYLVSPADCRLLVYPHIQIAKSIWIKGSKFTLESLLKSKTKAKYYDKCSIVICRLAPQDYHRFHFPVAGYYTKTKHIEGHYYSVKPSVVKSKYDVFTENKRTVTYLRTKYFQYIAIVAVGATCVGSIQIVTPSNTKVKKGQEYGRFAFGGSSLILLIPKGLITFDKDVMKRSQRGIETLVRMGESLGRL